MVKHNKLNDAISEFIFDRTSISPTNEEYKSSSDETERISKQILKQHPELSELIGKLSNSEGNNQSAWGDICYKRGWSDCLKIIIFINADNDLTRLF